MTRPHAVFVGVSETDRVALEGWTQPRCHLHVKPTSGSWLNMVEGWFAQLAVRQLRRGSFRSIRALEQASRRHIADANQNPKRNLQRF